MYNITVLSTLIYML